MGGLGAGMGRVGVSRGLPSLALPRSSESA